MSLKVYKLRFTVNVKTEAPEMEISAIKEMLEEFGVEVTQACILDYEETKDEEV